MNTRTCPDRQTLERLLLGKLPRDERDKWGDHLLSCDSCAALAEAVRASDELTDALQSETAFPGDEKILAEAIARASQLCSQVGTVQSGETDVAERPPDAQRDATISRSAPADGEIDFLAPAELPGEIGRLGGYRVLEVLGAGGMGMVFRAEDPRLEREVAIKVMKPSLAASHSAKDRFLREAKATAAIDHDNIVQIFQVGEDCGVPFIAMQFLRGESLRSLLKREQRLDQREVVRIGRQVAEGLAAAHKRGLIHRDIKPDNIWIEEGRDRAKILDFGLARAHDADEGLTQTGMVVGTPKYMAPEQSRGEAVDHRCDLFSLGSVLYHLASGNSPFERPTLTAVLVAVAQADCSSIEEVCPDIQPELARLINGLLSRKPDLRPQSAEAVVNTLRELEQKLQADQALTGQQALPTQTADLARAHAARPEPRRATRKRLLLSAAVAGLALAGALGLWAAAVVLRVQTRHGTLVVDARGPDFETAVRGKTITIRNVRTGDMQTIRLDAPETSRGNFDPGDYEFDLQSSSGLRTKTSRFEIRSGDEFELKVWWEPAAADAEKDAARALAEIEWTELQLTAAPAEKYVAQAAISPKGTYLAYVDVEYRVWLRAIDTGHTLPVAVPRDLKMIRAVWFPDETKMLLVARDSMWVAFVTGGAPHKLRDGAGLEAAVSPDGSQIVFTENLLGREIWLMGAGGENARKLHGGGPGDRFLSLAWYPDGQRLVYHRVNDTPGQESVTLETLDASTAESHVLVPELRLKGSFSCCCLPDGTVVFSRCESSGGSFSSPFKDLWAIPTDIDTGRASGEPQPLIQEPGLSLYVCNATRDGESLAIRRHMEQRDVYLAELEEGTNRVLKSPQRLTFDNREDWPDSWTPDSKAILIATNRRGNFDIYKQMIDGSPAQPLVAGPEDELGGRLNWDASSIIYGVKTREAAEQEGERQSRLMARPFEGGPPRMLARIHSRNFAFRCAPRADAPSILGQRLETQSVFYRLDLEQGSVGDELARIDIDPTGFPVWDLSPDATRIAVADSRGLRVVSLGANDVKQLPVADYQWFQHVAWSADGKGVFATPIDTDDYTIVYVTLDGQATVVWRSDSQWISRLRPSPDGRYLAFAAMTFDINIWLLTKTVPAKK